MKYRALRRYDTIQEGDEERMLIGDQWRSWIPVADFRIGHKLTTPWIFEFRRPLLRGAIEMDIRLEHSTELWEGKDCGWIPDAEWLTETEALAERVSDTIAWNIIALCALFDFLDGLVPAVEGEFVECPGCGNSGWSRNARGTGYDDICDYCAGQSVTCGGVPRGSV